MARLVWMNYFVHKFFEYDRDTIIYMKKGSEIVKCYAPPIPMLVDFYDMTIYVAKKGVALSERTTLQFNPDRMSFQTPNSAKTVINLEWKITGPCPGQWTPTFTMNLTAGHTMYIFGKILTGGLHRCFLRVGNILMKNLSDCITNN